MSSSPTIHLDHSPLAHTLAQKHGCKVHGRMPKVTEPEGGEVRMEAGDDLASARMCRSRMATSSPVRTGR